MANDEVIMKQNDSSVSVGIDTSSRVEFFDYYAKQSESPATRQRFLGLRLAVLEAYRLSGGQAEPDGGWDVADIGCGAGTQSMLWAQHGHRVHGLDINAPLIELAGQRAAAQGLAVDFHVGSAAALPWADDAMDVCLVPELLEHVREWEQCLEEFVRVLRPGGLLAITTNNTLCPIQHEFNLPLYSWYPAWLKHHYERLAVTTRPEVANYAKYPAVNWFTYYVLARELQRRGLHTFDRFHLARAQAASTAVKRVLLRSIQLSSVLRVIGHIATPYTLIVGFKSLVSR